jgi:hypothetical protein
MYDLLQSNSNEEPAKIKIEKEAEPETSDVGWPISYYLYGVRDAEEALKEESVPVSVDLDSNTHGASSGVRRSNCLCAHAGTFDVPASCIGATSPRRKRLRRHVRLVHLACRRV